MKFSEYVRSKAMTEYNQYLTLMKGELPLLDEWLMEWIENEKLNTKWVKVSEEMTIEVQ